ncbi:MAG TPA: type II secretion system protein GspK [Acetobacteraceae bacterium]|nr:type II secretion system protein GspK [Acetobacteraceae bacterium]
MTGRGSRQRGFALLVVLWTLAVLALLGSAVLATARQGTQLVGNLRAAAALRAAAHGAVQQAIFRLLDNSSKHWPADDIAHPIGIGAALVLVRIEDEKDKINPNIASAALLRSLLVQVGANPLTAATLAESIVAWRFGGGLPNRPNPTTARYVAAGLAYAPSGAPFASLDELGNVLGMTPALLARLRPHLTVFTDDDPNAGTLDPVVARAMAISGETGSPAGPGRQQVVSIEADARGAEGARFAESEVVRTNTRPEGRRYDVLDDEQSWRN